MEEDLVEVAEFTSMGEANIAKGLLESGGMKAFIFEHNRAYGLSIMYRIRLMVKISDMEEARKLLKETRR